MATRKPDRSRERPAAETWTLVMEDWDTSGWLSLISQGGKQRKIRIPAGLIARGNPSIGSLQYLHTDNPWPKIVITRHKLVFMMASDANWDGAHNIWFLTVSLAGDGSFHVNRWKDRGFICDHVMQVIGDEDEAEDWGNSCDSKLALSDNGKQLLFTSNTPDGEYPLTFYFEWSKKGWSIAGRFPLTDLSW